MPVDRSALLQLYHAGAMASLRPVFLIDVVSLAFITDRRTGGQRAYFTKSF